MRPEPFPLRRAGREGVRTLLDAAALTAGDAGAPAIVFVATGRDDVAVSRRAFRDEVARAAAALSAAGVAPGDLVVIAHTQELEAVFAFWGALRMGAVPSMFPTLTEKLDPGVYRRQVSELVAHAGARAVLTTAEFAPTLRGIVGCDVLATSDLMAGAPPAAPRWPEPDPARVAFLQHSSGTTGLQKGVALSHAAVLNQLAAYGDALGLREDDVVASWLPLYHDMGLIAGFLLPLVSGLPLVLMSPFDWVAHPALLLRAITRHRATLCWLPNFAYNHCARRIRERDLEGASLASLRALVNCSEPVRDDSHRAFVERFSGIGMTEDRLSVSYAMAENTFAVTQTAIGRPPGRDVVDRDALQQRRRAAPAGAGTASVVVVSCGPPIAGTEVKAVADDGSALPERAVGELAVRSDCMLTGYHHRPDLDATLLRDGWYLTGDMGYLAGGEAYVVGRRKDLIINGGRNLYPQDIEDVVGAVPGVHAGRVAAFGVPDQREGTELLAVVAEIDENAADEEAIARRVREAVLAATGVTATWVKLVDSRWLLKTSSGKVARAANRDKWLAERPGA